MSQIGQRAYDAVISPATVLACQPKHKRFHLRRDAWAAGIGTTAGTVELQRHQASMPGEKGIRLGNARDIPQSFAAESFCDLGQSGSLRIRQPEPRWQVRSEDAILGRQVFISQQQFLLTRPVTKASRRAQWNRSRMAERSS